MKVVCCVPHCKTKRTENHRRVFHVMPRDPHIRQQWCDKMNIKCSNSTHLKICTNHFKLEDYRSKRIKNRALLPNTIPSILPKILEEATLPAKPPANIGKGFKLLTDINYNHFTYYTDREYYLNILL